MSKHLKMLLGGSPCTHWSIAQKNNRETEQTGRRISSKTRKLEILAERRGGRKVKVKININNFVDRVIESINTLSEDKVCPNCAEKIEIDYETIRSISGIDIGFEIILQYIKDIAERAIKIDDPIILEALLNIGAISCSEEEEADY